MFLFEQEPYAVELKANVDAHEPDKEAWKKLCTNFLKGRLWWKYLDSLEKWKKKEEKKLGSEVVCKNCFLIEYRVGVYQVKIDKAN